MKYAYPRSCWQPHACASLPAEGQLSVIGRCGGTSIVDAWLTCGALGVNASAEWALGLADQVAVNAPEAARRECCGWWRDLHPLEVHVPLV